MLRKLKNDTPQKPTDPTASSQSVSEQAAPNLPLDPQADSEPTKNVGRLGDILIEERIITRKQLAEGLAKQREAGGFLGQALVDLGHIDQDTLTLILVKQCKIPHLNLHEYSISDQILMLIPAELCEKYHVLPVDKMGKILTVAMVDPLDVDALTAIRSAFPDLRIKPILCDWPHFNEVSQRLRNLKSDPQPEAMKEPDVPSPAAAKPAVPVPAPVKATPARVVPSVVAAVAQESPAPVSGVAAAIPVQAPVIDTDSLKAAIRDGVRETIAMFEQRLAEASELLRSVQETERNMVQAQVRQDLGAAPAAPSRRVDRVTALAPDAGRVSGADADARVLDDLERGTPRTAYSFDTFFHGRANQAAVQMASAVAKGAGKEFNPLFLCGDVGLGKTHLISAIGNTILASDPARRIGWTSAGRFAEHVAAAMAENAMSEFRQAYAEWDALTLDDIQFLGGRIEAQEELFHVFNALLERGRQIVIAGDRAPDRLGLLEKRLVSRFDSGQVTLIRAPEWETRVAILEHHARQLEAPAPEEVIAMIAMRFPNDVRRLIGALRKVAARAKLQGGSMTAALAGEILAEGGAEAAA